MKVNACRSTAISALLAGLKARCPDDAGPMIELRALDLPQLLGSRPRRPKTHPLNLRPDLRIVQCRHNLLFETLDRPCWRPRRNVHRIPTGYLDIGAAFPESRHIRQER